ncbi:hypothetical protein MRX96_053453 [Rhipicephalus microplus]
MLFAYIIEDDEKFGLARRLTPDLLTVSFTKIHKVEHMREIGDEIFDAHKWFDSLSGLTFGGDHSGLGKRGYGHGEFDEIDHAGWPGFYKRNFDEIDRTGFEGFYKRSAREE